MAMGYQGLAQIEINRDGSQGFVPLLIEGSSINMVLEPIYSEAIWGAGWYNAATNVNYADNAIRYEGGLDFQLQASANIWNLVRDWAIEYRAFSRAARITPDASWVYYYGPSQANAADYNNLGTGDPNDPIVTYQGTGRMGLWCQGMSLNTSVPNFVAGSLNCVALFRQAFGPAEGSPYGTSWPVPFDPDLTQTDPGEVSYIDDRFGLSGPNEPLNPFKSINGGPEQANFDPIPYWRTIAYIKRNPNRNPDGSVPSAGYAALTMGPDDLPTETVEWSVDLTNNTQVLYTCRGVRGASAVLQGSIDATGSVTLYNPYGLPDPVFGDGSGSYDEFTPYLVADNTEFVVQIVGTGAGSSNYLTIALPAIVVESDDYGIRGQNDVTNRTYTIKGLGGRLLGNLDDNIPYGNPSGYPGAPADLSLPPMIMTEAT